MAEAGEITDEAALERALGFEAASLLASYPDEEQRKRLGVVLRALEGASAAVPALPPEARRLVEDGEFAACVASAHIDVFDRAKQRNPIYESEYGRGTSKANALADVAAFYAAFGFAFGQEGSVRELPDHLAVELEFLCAMTLKEAALAATGNLEGAAITRDATVKFLAEHAGPFAPAVGARQGVRESPELSPLYAWCAQFVVMQCARLDLVPVPLTLVTDAPMGEMACAPTGKSLPVLSPER